MNKELNEKLAKWVGFKLEHTGVNGEIPVWLEPDDNFVPDNPTAYYFGGKNYGLPDFTDSLDACFKWLVPKLPIGSSIGIEIRGRLLEGDIQSVYVDMLPSGIEAEAKTPALALCKAIEKLIDTEPK